MCHEISSREDGFFFQPSTLFNVGQKTIDIVNGELVPPYFREAPYKVKTSPHPLWELQLSAQPTEQDLYFGFNIVLPTDEGEKAYKYRKGVMRKVFAGSHISQLYELSELLHVNDSFLTILVGFTHEDILFFDGKDVSVKRFFLPTPPALSSFIEGLRGAVASADFLDIMEEGIEKYKAFLVRR